MSEHTHDATMRSLPGSYLARGGARRFDAPALAGLGALALLLAAGVWLVVAALAPLPDTTPPNLPPVPEVSAPPARTAPIDQRRELVARLTADNPFAAGRRFWDANPAPAQVATAETPPPVPATPPSGVERAAAGPGSFMVTRREALPDDVRKALEGIELKQIHTDRDGALVARIGFVHSPQRETTLRFRVGDEFKDDANPQAQWTVQAIDDARKRVILRRSSHSVVLPLFATSLASAEAELEPASAAPAPGLGQTPAPRPEPTIVTRTRDEIITELRAANVSEEEIARLIALVDQPPVAAPGEAGAVVGRPPDQPADAATAAAEAGQAAPQGIEGILRMMTSKRPAAQPAQDPPPPPAPKP